MVNRISYSNSNVKIFICQQNYIEWKELRKNINRLYNVRFTYYENISNKVWGQTCIYDLVSDSSIAIEKIAGEIILRKL